jgi:hypothetical protein
MSGLPFLAALICLALVIWWYIREESVDGGSGRGGMLGVKDREDEQRQSAAKGPGWKSAKDAKPWRAGRK